MVFGHNGINSDRELAPKRSQHMSFVAERSWRTRYAAQRTSVAENWRFARTHKHGRNDILIESLEAENAGLALYRQLFEPVPCPSVLLEEYLRRMIAEEELHVGEVNKMLRKPVRSPSFKHDLRSV